MDEGRFDSKALILVVNTRKQVPSSLRLGFRPRRSHLNRHDPPYSNQPPGETPTAESELFPACSLTSLIFLWKTSNQIWTETYLALNLRKRPYWKILCQFSIFLSWRIWNRPGEFFFNENRQKNYREPPSPQHGRRCIYFDD